MTTSQMEMDARMIVQAFFQAGMLWRFKLRARYLPSNMWGWDA